MNGAKPAAIKSALMNLSVWASAGKKSRAKVVFPAPLGPAMMMIFFKFRSGFNDFKLSRMVFNILINNVDDHLNNHGFLHHAHGQWKLAPAFDLNPFPDKERALKTWISEDAGDTASLAEAVAVAPLFGFTHGTESTVLEEVKSAIGHWKSIARSIGMSAVDISSFAPAFEYTEL